MISNSCPPLEVWEDLGTVKAYHEANLALASEQPPFDFHSPDGVIYTRMRNLPASRLGGAKLERCLVSDGCVVEAGAQISRSILGVRSRIGRNAVISDTVLNGADRFETEAERGENKKRGIPDLGIGDGTVIAGALVDKDCRIGRNVRIVNHHKVAEAETGLYVIREGIVVIPKGTVVPDGAVI